MYVCIRVSICGLSVSVSDYMAVTVRDIKNREMQGSRIKNILNGAFESIACMCARAKLYLRQLVNGFGRCRW